MYRKELNERSPLRVFERSIHGGLGSGNIGVIMSRPGVGKTAFLVGVALDDLMRERKVLHITVDDTVEHVRQFYDEIFNELAEKKNLVDRSTTRVAIERNRVIHTYASAVFSIDKLRSSIDLLREHTHFAPDVIVIDGYPDFESADERDLKALKDLVVELRCEMWLKALTHREGMELDSRGIPTYVAAFEEYISVIVGLESHADHVRLNLLKDHESTDVANLHMELDTRTLLLRWR
jgi:hypothetical protein